MKRFVLPFQYSLFPFIVYIDIAHSFSSGILHNLSRIERAATITAVYKDETFSIDANVTFDHIFIIIVNNNILLDRIKKHVLRCLKQCSIISSNYSLFSSARRYLQRQIRSALTLPLIFMLSTAIFPIRKRRKDRLDL